MGNTSTVMNRKSTKPRVVLESPHGSETDASKTTRVTFANRKSNAPSFKAKPQMTDIGTMHADIYKSKVTFQRNQPIDPSGSKTDMKTSKTSIRSTGSIPPNGIWEPTLDPYDRTNSEFDTRLRSFSDRNGNSFNNYTGFTPRDYSWGTRVDNGLTKVEEI